MSAQHSPLPWRNDPRRIVTADGKTLVVLTGTVTQIIGHDDDEQTAKANAELICRAVNSHAALVAALIESERAMAQLLSAAVMAPASVRIFPPFKLGEELTDAALANARAVLTKVEGGE